MLLYFFWGMFIGGSVVAIFGGRKYLSKRYKNQNSNKIIDFLYKWIKLKQSKRNIQEYFLRRGYYKIAICGMSSMIGKILYDELENSEVCVLYGIGEGDVDLYKSLKIISINEELPSADIIVVSDFIHYFSIENLLKNKVDCKIVPIDDVIYEVS